MGKGNLFCGINCFQPLLDVREWRSLLASQYRSRRPTVWHIKYGGVIDLGYLPAIWRVCDVDRSVHVYRVQRSRRLDECEIRDHMD